MECGIVQSDTKVLTSPNGDKHAIMLAANLHEAASQEAMLVALLDRFKIQRMMSPPDTSMLLVTVIGACDADSFATRWRALVAADPVTAVFMSCMEKADFATALTPNGSDPQFRSLL